MEHSYNSPGEYIFCQHEISLLTWNHQLHQLASQIHLRGLIIDHLSQTVSLRQSIPLHGHLFTGTASVTEQFPSSTEKLR